MAAPASNGLSTITGELFSADNESLSFSAAALAKLVAEAPAADPADEADEEALRAGDASRADKILAKADRSSAAIRAIIAKIEDARATARARASRFDEQYAEPRWETFLTKKEILRLVRQRERAPESGIDLESEEEAKRRAARAARFGATAPSSRVAALVGGAVDVSDAAAMAEAVRAAGELDAARFSADTAGLMPLAEAVAARAGEAAGDFRSEAARRSRAERFGNVLPEDGEGAKAAAEALLRLPGEAAGSRDLEEVRGRWTEDEVMEGKALLGGGGPRPEAVHVVANGYIRAGDRDVFRLFQGFRPSFVEWLNSETLNVVFETAAEAARALRGAGKAVPTAPGVPGVPSQWLEGKGPLVKGKSDKWARKGAVTRVWLRPATADDTEENAVSTAGARTHGLLGERLRQQDAARKRQERMQKARERAERRFEMEEATRLDPRLAGAAPGMSASGTRRTVVLAAGGGGARQGGSDVVLDRAAEAPRRLALGQLSFRSATGLKQDLAPGGEAQAAAAGAAAGSRAVEAEAVASSGVFGSQRAPKRGRGAAGAREDDAAEEATGKRGREDDGEDDAGDGAV